MNRLPKEKSENARAIAGPDAIAPLVRDIARPGDFVVFLGAGNITAWAYALPQEIAQLAGNTVALGSGGQR